MLIVSYDLQRSSEEGWLNIKEISDKAMQNGYTVYCFSASTNEDYLELKNRYNLDFDLLFCDETTLKTIVRSNPGIVTLNKGAITGKWNWIDADDINFN